MDVCATSPLPARTCAEALHLDGGRSLLSKQAPLHCASSAATAAAACRHPARLRRCGRSARPCGHGGVCDCDLGLRSRAGVDAGKETHWSALDRQVKYTCCYQGRPARLALVAERRTLWRTPRLARDPCRCMRYSSYELSCPPLRLALALSAACQRAVLREQPLTHNSTAHTQHNRSSSAR